MAVRYVRRGAAAESAGELQSQAERARRHGFPFGVTVWRLEDGAGVDDADRVADADAVHRAFPGTVQSGADPAHFTLVLPDAVDAAVAARFNALFAPRG